MDADIYRRTRFLINISIFSNVFFEFYYTFFICFTLLACFQIIMPQDQRHTCEFCGRRFKYLRNMKRHIRRTHLLLTDLECSYCYRPFSDFETWREHMTIDHKPLNNNFQVTSYALDKNIIELTQFYFKNSLDEAMGESKE